MGKILKLVIALVFVACLVAESAPFEQPRCDGLLARLRDQVERFQYRSPATVLDLLDMPVQRGEEFHRTLAKINLLARQGRVLSMERFVIEDTIVAFDDFVLLRGNDGAQGWMDERMRLRRDRPPRRGTYSPLLEYFSLDETVPVTRERLAQVLEIIEKGERLVLYRLNYFMTLGVNYGRKDEPLPHEIVRLYALNRAATRYFEGSTEDEANEVYYWLSEQERKKRPPVMASRYYVQGERANLLMKKAKQMAGLLPADATTFQVRSAHIREMLQAHIGFLESQEIPPSIQLEGMVEVIENSFYQLR